LAKKVIAMFHSFLCVLTIESNKFGDSVRKPRSKFIFFGNAGLKRFRDIFSTSPFNLSSSYFPIIGLLSPRDLAKIY